MSRLTLRVELTDYYVEALVPESRRKITGHTFIQVVKGYLAILGPLEILGSPATTSSRWGGEGKHGEGVDRDRGGGRGLRRLFVHMANPFKHSMNFASHPQKLRNSAEKWPSFRLEIKSERRIMGEAYDGKWRVKCGEWRWAMEYLGYDSSRFD